jgi:glycosyltransferase involved in cell wall biosynthesis
VRVPIKTRGVGLLNAPHNKASRVLMIVENCPFPRDPRVRCEARVLQQSGYHVSVISPGWTRDAWRQFIDGVKVYQYPMLQGEGAPLGHLLEYTWAMLAIGLLTALVFFGDGFDIVQIANPPDCIILLVAIYKLFGKLVIYDQHDLCPELYGVRFGKSGTMVSSVVLLLEKISYRLADHVIVTNESYKRVALDRGGLSPSKISVVRNGPDLKEVQDIPIEPTLRSKARNIIVYAGITGFQDGVDFLCRALHSLRYQRGRSDFYCAILGDGDALPTVKSLAHDLGLDEVVWFAGWISDPALYARYLATADICASPEPSNNYNDRSTFVKVMEYMNAGKPIVAFDLPETRFTATEAALYARPNDEADFAAQIERLMDDPSLRRTAGQIGQQRIRQELAWDYSVPVLLEAYEKLLQPQMSGSNRGSTTISVATDPKTKKAKSRRATV